MAEQEERHEQWSSGRLPEPREVPWADYDASEVGSSWAFQGHEAVAASEVEALFDRLDNNLGEDASQMLDIAAVDQSQVQEQAAGEHLPAGQRASLPEAAAAPVGSGSTTEASLASAGEPSAVAGAEAAPPAPPPASPPSTAAASFVLPVGPQVYQIGTSTGTAESHEQEMPPDDTIRASLAASVAAAAAAAVDCAASGTSEVQTETSHCWASATPDLGEEAGLQCSRAAAACESGSGSGCCTIYADR